MNSNIFVFGTKESVPVATVRPNYSLNLKDQIYAIQWSPYDWSQDLICIAYMNNICVASCKFGSDNDSLHFETVHEFHHDTRVHCISWAPQTSLAVVPNILSFCVGGSDFQLLIFESDLCENHTCKVLSGHEDYINEISYEPEGRWISSVSDDQTCRLWATEDNFNCDVIFHLNSPGISVCWHTEDSGKLLIAEKNGIIRLYNAITQLAILSLEANDCLSSAHWCPIDSQRVTAFTGEKILIWDLTKPSRLVESNSLHSEKGGLIKFNSTGELIASLSLVGGMLKVSHGVSKNVLLSASLKLPVGLSWHQRLPVVTVADDKKLCFWKLLAK